MTDKQPEALRLADELEEPLHDFPEPTTLEAKAAAELRRLHTESEMRRAALLDEMQKAALAALLEKTVAQGSLRDEAAFELLRQYAENATLRMGYNAARLEIESRKAQHTGAVYAELHEPDATTVGLGAVWNRHSMRDFADATHALRASHGQAPQQSGVGNSGFDHKTAADFLTGKNVSDEAMRKFVAASRWAHDDRASLQATLQSVRNELASREAEIALLKTALMNAEEAAPTTQPSPALPDNAIMTGPQAPST